MNVLVSSWYSFGLIPMLIDSQILFNDLLGGFGVLNGVSQLAWLISFRGNLVGYGA